MVSKNRLKEKGWESRNKLKEKGWWKRLINIEFICITKKKSWPYS